MSYSNRHGLPLLHITNEVVNAPDSLHLLQIVLYSTRDIDATRVECENCTVTEKETGIKYEKKL